MTLKLKNTWLYNGSDWWNWEAFIDDEGSGELSNIANVQYVLHETFPDPIRLIDSPQNGFRLETEGWGAFELKAFVNFKDGSKKKLIHTIQLEQNPKKGTTK